MTTKEKLENFNPSMRVGGIVFRCEDEVLLFKRALHKKFGAGQWALCAGKIEGNEEYIDGVVRECFEETGIMITKDKLEYINTYYHSPELDRNFEMEWKVFQVKVEIKPEVKLNDEHSEYKWININDVNTYDLIDGENYCLNDYFVKCNSY